MYYYLINKCLDFCMSCIFYEYFHMKINRVLYNGDKN